DKYGKQQTTDEDLKAYIINIYKTVMYRAIKGTYIYACDKNLREYFKQHVRAYKEQGPLRILDLENVKPYVNAVPLIDIYAAAGSFSEEQISEKVQWVELPMNISVKEDYFVCQVIGESMNRKIENGSWCLFKRINAEPKEGDIVLVEHYNIQDSDFGSGYTVKTFHSKREIINDNWVNKAVVLKPSSFDANYKDIIIAHDEIKSLRVIGEYITTLYI